MDLQKLIDDLLARYPQTMTYVEWVQYVPQGILPPTDNTHTLRLVALNGSDLVVALRVKEPYKTLADALLGVL